MQAAHTSKSVTAPWRAGKTDRVFGNAAWRAVVRLTLSAVVVVTAAVTPLVLAADGANNPHVVIRTSYGDMTVELYPDKAPKAVANFLQYVDDDFYDETIVHRVLRGRLFGISGIDAELEQRPRRGPIPSEADNGLYNDKWMVSMWHDGYVNQSTSEFFINVRHNADLNHLASTQKMFGFTVFGRVVNGIDVAEAIGVARIQRKDRFRAMPEEPIEIYAVDRIDAPAPRAAN